MNGKDAKDLGFRSTLLLEVYDKDGNLIQRVEQPAKTWVVNMLLSLWFYLDGALSLVTGTDVNGNGITVTIDDRPKRYLNARAGNDNYGILVGSSDAPYNQNHYNLQAKISHGTSTGKLEYGDTNAAVITDSIYVDRAFTNRSGSNVTVKEIGLFLGVNRATQGDWVYFMLARDVITPITVPHLANLKVEYRIKVL